MMVRHAAHRRTLADQLGLPEPVTRPSALQTSSGTAAVGRGGSRGRPPTPARVSDFAEFMEVAHRVGGVGGRDTWPARALGGSSTRHSPQPCRTRPRRSSAGSTASVWDAVIDAEPSLGVVLTGDASTTRSRRSRLRRPQVPVRSATHGRSPTRGRRRQDAGLPSRVRALRRAGLVHDFGRLGVSNTIWDKPGPLGAGEWERVRLHPYLTERMLAGRGAGAAGADRGAAPRAARRLGLPALPTRAPDLGPARHPGRGRRVPSDARAAPAPAGAIAGRRRGRAAGRGARRAARRGRGRRRARGRRPPGAAPPRWTGGPDRARGRGARAGRSRAVEQGDRRAARDLAEDGRNHVEHIYTKIGTSTPHRQPVRDAARAGSGRCARALTEDGTNAPCAGVCPAVASRHCLRATSEETEG